MHMQAAIAAHAVDLGDGAALIKPVDHGVPVRREPFRSQSREDTAPLIFCGLMMVVYSSMIPFFSSASIRPFTATRERPTSSPISNRNSERSV